MIKLKSVVSFVLFIPFFVFGFWSLLATMLQKYYIISYITLLYFLQGMMGKNTRKENHTIKVTEIPKTKRQKNGTNKALLSLDTNSKS